MSKRPLYACTREEAEAIAAKDPAYAVFLEDADDGSADCDDIRRKLMTELASVVTAAATRLQRAMSGEAPLRSEGDLRAACALLKLAPVVLAGKAPEGS